MWVSFLFPLLLLEHALFIVKTVFLGICRAQCLRGRRYAQAAEGARGRRGCDLIDLWMYFTRFYRFKFSWMDGSHSVQTLVLIIVTVIYITYPIYRIIHGYIRSSLLLTLHDFAPYHTTIPTRSLVPSHPWYLTLMICLLALYI